MIALQKSLLRIAALLLAVAHNAVGTHNVMSPLMGRYGPAPLARTDLVRYDNYSLWLQNQRVFLHGGEFHTFRLPVPSLWPDILDKIQAAGLNSVSVYTHMGMINPAPGVVDFDGYRAYQPLFDAAKAAGLWVVLRPGPYINAETTAGGIAHWATSQVAGSLRTSASDWEAAWQDYIAGVINQTAPNQISHGGPVIDNEYSQNPASHAEYFQQLQDVYHASPIDVLLTYNDAGPGSNFINGTGAVDLYGMDSYTQGADCSNPDDLRGAPLDFHQYHERVNPWQVWWSPEYQAGSFDGWGPGSPGYEKCAQLTGPKYQSVFNKQMWASNAKMISYYMYYGSWYLVGRAPIPSYTSYDYGSTIAENRELRDKFAEMKFQGIFIRSSPEFTKTDWISDSSNGLQAISDSAAFATYLQNPDTQTGFYVLRHSDTISTALTDFNLTVSSSAGTLQVPTVVPAITLDGRQSKLVVVDYSFGASKVLYSTAQVFFAGTIGGRSVLFLYGDSTQAHEVRLTLTGTNNEAHQTTSSLVTFTPTSNQTTVGFQTGLTGLHTVWDSNTQLVLYADSPTAATFFAPVIPGDSNYGNYWQIGTNSSVLVGGPYLVRKASISGSVLALTGDLETTVPFTVIAPPSVELVTWNGAPVDLHNGVTVSGGFNGSLSPRSALKSVSVPELTGWKYMDSFPEIKADFDDSKWIVANHTTTNIPLKPYFGDGRILYGCDYGYCENIVLWRGHFNSTGVEESVELSINGGRSVWLNDAWIGTAFGSSANHQHNIQETGQNYTFPAGALRDGDNVVTIIQDNMGLDEAGGDTEYKSPRGVRGFLLHPSGTFGDWKVQGKIGGYTGFPDKVRGVMNEGGLYGERKGWHLPGFDTSSWESRDLALGSPGPAAGVGFFVTTFELEIPSGVDAFISFTFEEELGQDYRIYLFVNGWMMGKRVANLGPQAKFPVHQGILNYQGTNTVAVALWSLTDAVKSPKLSLVVDKVLDGGVSGVTTNNPQWSPDGRE
ncbi:glycoside hydrolase family 35 protein [Favolaschia claudopus]|uniref:beta-galactosidase n=1 Tax=Favolaschia claudopus TaxID=2862362 RepID=A0AAW0CY27_9AGAR